MKKITTLLLLCLFAFAGSAQNIVTNGGFETYNFLPAGYTQWNACANWNACGGGGSADYFHNNATGGVKLPNTGAGTYVYPHTGDAIMGFLTWSGSIYPDYREYICTQLNTPMVPGVTYDVSFYLTNGQHPYYGYGSDNIGLYFSSTQPTQPGVSVISVTPQVEVTTIFYDTSWVYFHYTFTPTVAYQYLTIGNFRYDATTSATQFYPNVGRAYYHIDDIVITPITGGTKPKANFGISGLANLCVGGCTTFNNFSTNAKTYAWSFPGGTPSTSNQSNPGTICYNTPGLYNVQLIAFDSLGVSDTMLLANAITVQAGPSAGTVSANPTSICSGDSAHLTTTGSSGLVHWMASTNGTVFNQVAVNVTSYTSPPITQTTYYRVIANNACGLDTSLTVTVTVSPGPVPGTVAAVPDSLCTGSTSQLSATGSSGTVQWETSTNGTTYNPVPGATQASYTTPPLTQNTYYRVMVSNTCGSSASAAAMITIIPGATAGLLTATRDTICENTLLTSTLSVGGSTGTLQWESSTDGINYTPMGISAATYTTPVMLPQTTYYRVLATSGGCPADTTPVQIVYVVPSPFADYNFVASGLQVTFSSTTAGGVTTYFWDFADGSSNASPNPSHTYAVAGKYEVCLTVYNQSNCSYTICKTLELEDVGIEEVNGLNPIVLYPNPASEQLNVNLAGLRGEYQLMIYNTLGQQLFTQTITVQGDKQVTVAVKNLPAGAYHLVLNAANSLYNKPFIILR